MLFRKLIRSACGAAAIAMVATATYASTLTTLSISGTGTSTTLPASFDPFCGGCTTPTAGDAVTVFESGTDGGNIGGGLYISGNSTVKYTFLGKEASAENALFTIGGASLSNTMAVGSSITVSQTGPGFVDFFFQTQEKGWWEDINGNGTFSEFFSITNGLTTQFSGLAIAFSAVFNNGRSVLAFFGDGRGDNDYDDMVIRIDIVPLPATALMLLGAVGGLGALRLRRKTA